MLIKHMLSSLQKEYCKNIFFYSKATSQILGMQPSFHVSKENMEKICFMATIKSSSPALVPPLSLPLVGACTGPHSQHFGPAHTLVIKASTDPSLILQKKKKKKKKKRQGNVLVRKRSRVGIWGQRAVMSARYTQMAQ